MPPRPVEVPATSPSAVQSYLMGQRSTAASPQVSLSGYGSGGSTPAGTPTAPKKTFGVLPQPSSSPMGPPATTQPLHRRSQTPGASPATSPATAGSSQHPGLFSTIPSLNLGTLPGTSPHKAGGVAPSISSAGLAVATPGLSIPAGSRSSFTTNP